MNHVIAAFEDEESDDEQGSVYLPGLVVERRENVCMSSMSAHPVNAKPNRCSACLLKPIAVLYVIPYITTVLMLISMIYCALISYNQVPVLVERREPTQCLALTQCLSLSTPCI